MVIYPHPLFMVINLLLSWIMFICYCICILTGSTGYYIFMILYVIQEIGDKRSSGLQARQPGPMVHARGAGSPTYQTTARFPKGRVRPDQDTIAMDWGGGDTERGPRGV